MAKISKAKSSAQQTKTKKREKEIASRQKSVEQRERETQRRAEKRAQDQARWAARRTREYQKKLRDLEKFGIYQPKDETLTRYRKTRINKLTRQFGDFMNSEKFFFVAPKGSQTKDAKEILKRAKNLQMPVTRKGIFYEKQGAKRAGLAYNKKTKEYELRVRGKTKRGANRGKAYSTNIPLAPLDAIAKSEKALRDRAAAFGKLGKNDRLAFKVVEKGKAEGYSRSTFTNIDLLMRYLDRYRKNTADTIAFYRHIIIEKTTVDEWFRLHPRRANSKMSKRMRARGRN